MPSPDIHFRRATEDDLDNIVTLARAALGWDDSVHNTELFRWKHLENPFGASPMWVAESGDRLAGFRALLRWRLRTPDGREVVAVRAVDTATHPDFQRRGIFSRLNNTALDDLGGEGLGVVFNTPNSQSRPGYLKLGWVEVGNLPTSVRLGRPLAVPRLLRARVPAQKWSEPCAAGADAAAALADPGLDGLLGSQPAPAGWATAADPAFYRWRYRFAPLHYRAFADGPLEDGVALFRVRRRGPATEAVLGHVLVPDADRRRSRQLVRKLLRSLDVDYVLRLGAPDVRGGFLPLPGQGPMLTARSVNDAPPTDIASWELHMGDIELF